MEPLLVGEDSRSRGVFTDLALDLAQNSAGVRHSLPESQVGLACRSGAGDERLFAVWPH